MYFSWRSHTAEDVDQIKKREIYLFAERLLDTNQTVATNIFSIDGTCWRARCRNLGFLFLIVAKGLLKEEIKACSGRRARASNKRRTTHDAVILGEKQTPNAICVALFGVHKYKIWRSFWN